MLVAVEGVDGSGKGTQARLLEEHARGAGLGVTVFSFPRYGDNLFATIAGRFLDGWFGDAAPELAALPYAGDRWLAKPDIERALADGHLVICDRYVASNMAHQAARTPPDKRPNVLGLITSLEFDVYALPAPDLTILLDVPPEMAQNLVLQKAAREYTDRAQDMLEADARHIAAAQEVYASLVDPSWRVVEAMRGGELRPAEEIADEVWEAVRSRL